MGETQERSGRESPRGRGGKRLTPSRRGAKNAGGKRKKNIQPAAGVHGHGQHIVVPQSANVGGGGECSGRCEADDESVRGVATIGWLKCPCLYRKILRSGVAADKDVTVGTERDHHGRVVL